MKSSAFIFIVMRSVVARTSGRLTGARTPPTGRAPYFPALAPVAFAAFFRDFRFSGSAGL